MDLDIENTAENFLEISSEQRLNILFLLNKQKLSLSKIAKELDASPSEVHRNISRLLKSNLIEKDSESNFFLTALGKSTCMIIPSFSFVFENNSFFKNHDFGNLEIKFIQRLGSLIEHKKIKGFVKVLETWKSIHENAEEYIYNILPEVPYFKEIIEIVEKKLKSEIPIRSIFSESTIVPEERKKIFENKNFQKFVKNGVLDRRMMKNISIVTLFNEKEAAIIFPTKNGEPDLSEMFYSTDIQFHDWCVDFFNFCWKNSGSFQDSKLNQ